MKSSKNAPKANECSELAAINTIRQLEECFTCPMCLEVMARPYSTRRCGHDFCATCILTWFFFRSSLWSGFDVVDCPICRSALIDSSENSSSPFIPNKTADGAIRAMIDTLSKEDDHGKASAALAEWGKDGRARQEWSRKERDGYQEMSILNKLWPNVGSDDYIDMKTRLGLRQESDLL
ncbi:hypothetical protein M405DRAFT_776806 [Rhizopogon salebrosus TDB-379]|nr:hypothetical protein M405DRAFT_776806 [Rhizopogon salebrosus TDB-379]